MVSTRSSRKYDYSKLNNGDSSSDDENADVNTSSKRASSQSKTPSKKKAAKNNKRSSAKKAVATPAAVSATDDDTMSDDSARTRPTHFTRKASSVAAAATGGGDGSGPSVVDRDRHDIFNVVALLPLVFLTLANYDWAVVWASFDPEAAWTDKYFWEYWVATTVYFFVDTVWVWKVPTCVKAPGVIIKVCIMIYSHMFVRYARMKLLALFDLRNATPVELCIRSPIPISFFYIITAPRCNVAISDGARALSRIPMGHGCMLIGGDQHLVPHYAPCGLLAEKTCAESPCGIYEHGILCVVDCHPLHTVSADNGDLSAKMSRGVGGDRNADALADRFCSGPWYLLCPQFQVVVRFVYSAHCWMVQVGRWQSGAEGEGEIVKGWRIHTSDKFALVWFIRAGLPQNNKYNLTACVYRLLCYLEIRRTAWLFIYMGISIVAIERVS